jgi:HAD superfamily hydrolase (TIGR01459 family)
MTLPISGLSEIADRYDGYIVDLWGVMHDGVQAFPAAVDCLRRLKARGSRIAILSNAPRRSESAAQRSAAIGITPDLYDAMITSGEDCWQRLAAGAPGKRALFIRAGWDNHYLDGLDVEAVDDPAQADFALVLGVDNDTEKLDPLEPTLRAARERGLLMICANPDLIVMHGGAMRLCAGAVAQRYEALGGRTEYHGKPHAPVYARAFAALGVDRSRILAIGDSLRTDITGARDVGIASLFIADGIHREELVGPLGGDLEPAHVAERLSKNDPAPNWVASRLSW